MRTAFEFNPILNTCYQSEVWTNFILFQNNKSVILKMNIKYAYFITKVYLFNGPDT